VEQYTAGGRPELAAKEQAEIVVLEMFLPQPLSSGELESLVRATIQEVGAMDKKQMGAVMKAVQAKVAGRADGKTISALVSRLLP
jgi:uncharacterized protein YqeY